MRLFRCLPVCAVALAHAGCFSPTGSVFTTQTTTTGDLTTTTGPGATSVASDTPSTGSSTEPDTTTTGVVATTSATSDPTTDPTIGPTTSSDPSTTTATTNGPPVCGDGEKAGDEECDDGLLNGDTNLCTSACKLAVCGDGLTCTTCTVPEECDDANMVETDGCTSRCLDGVRYVFVTADQFQFSFGGLAGADALCSMAAVDDFNPKRKFVAWLSDGDTAANGRIWGGPDLPYRTRTGELVADNIGDLLDGSLQHAIDRDEHGDQVAGDNTCVAGSSAWTGTAPSGDKAGEHCNSWLALGGSAQVGNVVSVNARWTQDCALPCDKMTYLRLYCIEKGG